MSGPASLNSSLSSALRRLKEAIALLPESTPEGSIDGLIWRSFSTRPQDVKGPIFNRVNEALSECFLSDTSSGVSNILRGTFGMDVVIRSLEECAKYPTMSSSDLYILELKIGQLTDLIHARIKSLPSDKPKPTRKRKQTRKASKPSKRSRKRSKAVFNASDSTSDSEFEPSAVPDRAASSGLGSDGEIADKAEPISPSVDISRSQSPTDPDTTFMDKSQVQPGRRPGPKDDTRQWALANWKEPVATWHPVSNKPVWLFRCKYCDAIRRFSRSEGCLDFTQERISLNSGNLASHLQKQCHGIPPEQKLDAVRARSKSRPEALTPAQQSIGTMFRSSTTAPPKPPTTLSNTAFRAALIQGVVCDNYPLTFGEGEGMQMVFSLLSPSIKLPSHQTMRQDLAQLFNILSARVRQLLQAQNSRFAVSSDAWTSKTSLYSLSGVIVTFIDKDWNMQELLIDIVNLDADHTGKGMGQRLFRSLDHMNAAGNVIASMTDNASNNLTMNAELSRRLKDKFELSLNVESMSVTCLCHALHLICGSVLEHLNAVNSLECDEVYAAIKSSDHEQTFEEYAEVQDHEEIHYNEDMDGSDHGLSDSETGPITSENPAGLGSTETTDGPLNPVQKVHAIAVHSTGSPLRRKKMRTIALSLGLDPLAVVKSTRIRWNSVLAEIRRALKLKAAFNQYVATLDEGNLADKYRRKARALKRRWCISDEEWDVLEELVRILEPFEAATNDFSKRGRTALHSVLPTYAYLRAKFAESRSRLNLLRGSRNDVFGMLDALAVGEEKLDKYFKLAQESDLTLIASILHPGMRLALFEDMNRLGDLGLATRGRTLISYLYEMYKHDIEDLPPANDFRAPASMSASRGFIDNLIDISHPSNDLDLVEELLEYFNGKYRYLGGDVLVWWKEHEIHFPVLSRIARDFLAVPATSVSVERLFSRCKLVMTEYRNMSVQTARQIIACQQWLVAGLGVDLPDFVLSS